MMPRAGKPPTQAAIAQAIGLAPTIVGRYVRMGMPISSPESARAWMAENVRPRVGGQNGQGEYQHARTRWAQLEAERRELDLLEHRGVLVHRATIKAELSQVFTALRQALQQVPTRLQSVLAAEADEAKVHDLLQDEMDGIMALIAESG